MLFLEKTNERTIMNLAPIVLFTYNRPEHTEKTLESLMQNDLANKSILHVFCDGPKNNAPDEQIEKINKVREVVRKKQWCKEVAIIESKTNRGLGSSIEKGVTEIVNKYGKVIVLEDDLILSIGFLKYLNEALELYKDNEQVMQICGMSYSSPILNELPESFLIKYVETCGWGTWARAWKHYNPDAQDLYDKIKEKDCFFDLNINGITDYKQQLEANINGALNTWGVKWLVSVYLKEGLGLFPSPTLVKNIGFDGSGDNCTDLNNRDKSYWKKVTDYIKLEKLPIAENPLGRRHLEEMMKIYYNKC